jgi:hypothetical protein
MSDLTVICALWVGDWKGVGRTDNRQYTPIYAERLKDMVARHTSYEFDFMCLTNLPADRFREDIIVHPLERPWPAWWAKMEAFNPDLPVGERVLMLDLDLLVVGDLDEVIEWEGDFGIYDYWAMSGFATTQKAIKTAKTKKGCELIPNYSSDMIVFDRGARNELYTELGDEEIKRFCGDQDWIGWRMPREEMFPEVWTRKLKKSDRGPDPVDFGNAKTIACHPIKNHMLADKGYQYADAVWRGTC